MSDERPEKRRKKWPLIVLGVLVFILAFLLFLPGILSASFVRTMLVAKVNESLEPMDAGEVEIDRWKFRWFGNNELEGIRYIDAAGHKVADIDSVIIQKGLADLARKWTDMGVIKIGNPVIDVRIADKEAENASPPPDDSGAAPRPRVDGSSASEVDGAPLTLPVNVNIEITSATLRVASPEGGQPVAISELDSKLIVDKNRPGIQWKAEGVSGSEGSPLEFDVTLKPLLGGAFNPENVTANGYLKAISLELGPILDLAAAINETVPTGNGFLSADLTFASHGKKDIAVSGEITGLNLNLKGGALGLDEPNIGDVKINFQASQSESGFLFEDTEVHSKLIRASVIGQLPKVGEGTIDFNGHVDLAALANELPHTLRLQEGLEVKSGSLHAAAQLNSKGDTHTLGSTLVVSNVAGDMDGKNVALTQPVELQLAAVKSANDVDVQSLTVTSSFLKAEGKGNIDNFSVTAKASLQKGLEEASQFLDLGGWQVMGDANMNFSMLKLSEQERQLTLGLESPAFYLQQDEKEIVPEQSIKVHVDAVADVPEDGFLKKVYRLESSFDTAIASGRLNLSELLLSEANEVGNSALPLVETIALNTSIDLERLNDILPRPTNGPPVRLMGAATLAVSGSVSEEGVQADHATMALKELLFESGSKSFYQKNATVQSKMLVRPENKSAVLSNVVGSFSAGEFRADRIELKNWEDVINTLDARISSQFDLAQLSRELAAWQTAEQSLPMDGVVEIHIDAVPDGANDKKFSVDAALQDFVWTLKNQQVVTDSNVTFQVSAHFADDMNDLKLTGMKLSSTPLSLESDLALNDLKGDGMLNAKGRIVYDMAKMEPYIKALSGQKLNARGSASKPFTLRVPLGSGEKEGPVVSPYFDSAFFVESMNFYGMNIIDLEIPILLEDNLLQTSLDAQVNNGRLAFYPSIDLGAQIPKLSIPTNSMVLTDVGLTDQLADELLGKIHPIFKGAAIANGKVDMLMDYLEVPTAGDLQKGLRFAGTFALKDVKLSGSPLVGLALKLAKVKEGEYGFEQEEMHFVCESGWITPSPLKINVEEFPLTFAGRLGLDGTLQYSVSVPITKKIIDEKYAKYLEGESITIPVSGTVAKPRIPSDALQQALKPLIAEGAKRAAGELLNEKAGKLLEGLFR